MYMCMRLTLTLQGRGVQKVGWSVCCRARLFHLLFLGKTAVSFGAATAGIAGGCSSYLAQACLRPALGLNNSATAALQLRACGSGDDKVQLPHY